MAGAFFFPSFLSFLAGAGETWEKKKLFILLLFAAAAAAAKEKVAVLNMSPDDLHITICRENHRMASCEITQDKIHPQIIDFDYHEKAQLNPMLNISASAGKRRLGPQELSFPLFNGKNPTTLREEGLADLSASAVSFFKSFPDPESADIELIPVWTIHSFEYVAFGVYLLHSDGKIYATPHEHDYYEGDTEEIGKPLKRQKVQKKLDPSELKTQTKKSGKTKESISKTKDIEDWRIGIRSKLKDKLRVEIFSGDKRMERHIDENDESLHILDTKYDIHDFGLGCKEELLDGHTLSISILNENGKVTDEATFFIFNSYSISKLKAFIPLQDQEDAKGNGEYIFVWTFDLVYAHFELHRINSKGETVEILDSISQEEIGWFDNDSDEDFT